MFQLTIKLPHTPGETKIMVSSQEQVQDIRQSIVDTPDTFQYSCFHLEHAGQRINDFIELSEVKSIQEDPVLKLIEDPYTEAQARMHIVRVRELIGAAGNRIDVVAGIDAGLSLCDSIPMPAPNSNPVENFSLTASSSISTLLPLSREPPPKTIKTLSLSAWNPPPYHLRSRGHHLYLVATTLEGEQHYITSSTTGFTVNKSTAHKFDPAPKSQHAHSLITLFSHISPTFAPAFRSLQEYNGQRDPLAAYQLSNSIPAAPWLVPIPPHSADLTRTQEPLLLQGADNAETLRDWNEEFQSTRELPKLSVQDRVFRERLTAKLFAEYNDAAVRGAVLVGRGEVQPLNPTEGTDAQIFVYNNVFYSFGADGVGTFAGDGGDEAARVATGKDVQGVRAVNQLDIDGLFTPGTVVVDYLGKRIVGQSIVPGIFKQRAEGEHQIDYGGVEGKDVIASREEFVPGFKELSKQLRVQSHSVWDKEGKEHMLEASVETKGLLGTDGRKYVLDLYRTTPLDIAWLEKYYESGADDWEESGEGVKARYLHRMTVIRRELVEGWRIVKLRAFIGEELERRKTEKKALTNGDDTNGETDTAVAKTNGDKADASSTPDAPQERESVDISSFSFALNPDVFSGQQPQTDSQKTQWAEDERAVRDLCTYLTAEVIPRFLRDIAEGELGFPMDGANLVRDMHKRGINARYLGLIAKLAGEKDGKRMQALGRLARQAMVVRAFKHVLNSYLKPLPAVWAAACVSHMLNCLLGGAFCAEPKAEIEEGVREMFPEIKIGFESVTVDGLEKEVRRQIGVRFRSEIEGDVVEKGWELQVLREVCLTVGVQLESKDYAFRKAEGGERTLQEKPSNDSLAVPNGNGHANGAAHSSDDGASKPKPKKNKKKRAADHSPAAQRSTSISPTTADAANTTFTASNVLNLVPRVKDASPRSLLAEEALDAGRLSLQTPDQKALGQELLLESLSLHEQIYGILHPEVARVYYALSTLYYGLDEKAAAVELARKAVIVSERTLGPDHAETVLAYLNLGLFEHAVGNTRPAIAYMLHALSLWKLVYGATDPHPDSITTLNNLAVMLQTLKLFHPSRLYFETSLALCETVAGKESINTATVLFQLAQALTLDGSAREGVECMRRCAGIFRRELGENDANTREAEEWLGTLTFSAVSQARSRRNLEQRGLGETGTLGPLSGAKGIKDDVGKMDSRNLEELVKYIGGKDGLGGGNGGKKKTTRNPKGRRTTTGAASASAAA